MDSTQYFQKYSYYQHKGKGISVYNSNKNDFLGFINKSKEALINFQSILLSEPQLIDLRSNVQLLVIFQDLDIAHLYLKINELINKLVFPAYFRNIPIAFFSVKDKTAYEVQIESSTIHFDFESVVNSLYIEQMESILSLARVYGL